MGIGQLNPRITETVVSLASVLGVVALMAFNGSVYQVDTFHHDVRQAYVAGKQALTNRW